MLCVARENPSGSDSGGRRCHVLTGELLRLGRHWGFALILSVHCSGFWGCVLWEETCFAATAILNPVERQKPGDLLVTEVEK